ncbi:hypothetical protein [Aeromonas salmonicida]|uniref:hypothetical protein n=1 Tax=Aeromonas salmonicida TaxID=645 RepID=UPI000B3FAF4D|nr:hypothetical protein [Aeromonas salmonicida]ARW84547.1 hypothetical protein O23A_p3808 [Aeromonas salmonicida]
MPALKKSDLNYEDYSWTAVPGDDPSKRVEDADRFSRKEGYEVLYLLNSLTGENNKDLAIKTRLVCEWMIHEKLPSNIQGRAKVISWLVNNYESLQPDYPF